MVISENPELTPLILDSRSERLQIIFYAYFMLVWQPNYNLRTRCLLVTLGLKANIRKQSVLKATGMSLNLIVDCEIVYQG